jgi:hypothetical protein
MMKTPPLAGAHVDSNSVQPRERWQAHKRHERAHNYSRNGDDGATGILLPSPAEPMAVARIFADKCLHNGTPTLRH